MTTLKTKVVRQTNKVIGRRNVIITIAPGTSTREDMIGLRLKGTREIYTACLSDLYRTLAFWHGNKLRIAKSKARKDGVKWKYAKRQFDNLNRL